MLWIPALCGTVLFFSQLYTRPMTHSWDTPMLLPFACVMSLWTVALGQLWKRLEAARKFEELANPLNGEHMLQFCARKKPAAVVDALLRLPSLGNATLAIGALEPVELPKQQSSVNW